MPSQKKNSKTLSTKRKRDSKEEDEGTSSKAPKKNQDRMITRLLSKTLSQKENEIPNNATPTNNTNNNNTTKEPSKPKKVNKSPKKKTSKSISEKSAGTQDAAPDPQPQQPSKPEKEVESLLVPQHASTKATEHLQKSLKRILKNCATSNNSEGFEVDVDDNLYKWKVKLFGFDKSLKLAKDLKKYQKKHPERDHVMIEAIFPHNFPTSPPFLRVVYPRFVQYTGHITIGGSICVEDLTLTGWKPENLLESFFVMIRHLLIEGGARINFDYNVDYSEYEAKSAFNRVARDHGWKV